MAPGSRVRGPILIIGGVTIISFSCGVVTSCEIAWPVVKSNRSKKAEMYGSSRNCVRAHWVIHSWCRRARLELLYDAPQGPTAYHAIWPQRDARGLWPFGRCIYSNGNRRSNWPYRPSSRAWTLRRAMGKDNKRPNGAEDDVLPEYDLRKLKGG